MKIAGFKTFGIDNHVSHADENTGEACVKYSGWVRLTEYSEVEFIPLPTSTVVEGQLKQLDVAEQELRNQFEKKLHDLANERAKLLSLTHDAQS